MSEGATGVQQAWEGVQRAYNGRAEKGRRRMGWRACAAPRLSVASTADSRASHAKSSTSGPRRPVSTSSAAPG